MPTLPHSAESFPHLTHVFHIHLKILQNHRFYRISLDSHQIHVKSLIQGTLAWSKDILWVVVLYTNGGSANGACQSGTERNRLRQEMDRWIERRRGGAWGGNLGRIWKHSWMTFFAMLGWFRIQSTKCWQVCRSNLYINSGRRYFWQVPSTFAKFCKYTCQRVLCLLIWWHQQRVASHCFGKLWFW